MQIEKEKKKKRRDTCAMWKHVDPKRDGSRLCRGYTAHGTARLLTRKIGSLGVAFEGRCRLWQWGRRWLEPVVEMEFAGWSLKSSHWRVGVANGSGGEFSNRSTILRSLAVLLHAGSFATAAFPCTYVERTLRGFLEDGTRRGNENVSPWNTRDETTLASGFDSRESDETVLQMVLKSSSTRRCSCRAHGGSTSCFSSFFFDSPRLGIILYEKERERERERETDRQTDRQTQISQVEARIASEAVMRAKNILELDLDRKNRFR